MAKVVFDNGQTVEFDRTPSPQDIDEVAQKLGISKAIAEPKTSPLTSNPIEQKAGYVPKPSELSGLLPKKQDLPVLAGSVIGGMVGGVPGAALGAAGGEAYKQLGQRAKIIPGTPPPTSTKAAEDIGKAGVLGAGSEFLGSKIVNPIVGKIFSPFASSVTPEIKAQIDSASNAGIKAPLSNMTENPFVQGLERHVEVSPWGSKITRMRDDAVKGLEAFSERISKIIAPDTPAEIVGEGAKQHVKSFEKVFRDAKSKIYNSVLGPIANVKPQIDNTIAALEDIISRRSGTAEPAGLNQFRQWLEEIKPKATEPSPTPFRFQPATEKVIEEGNPYLAVPREVKTTPGQMIGDKGGSLNVATHGIGSPAPEGSINTFQSLRNFRTNVGSRGKFDDPGVVGMKADIEKLYAAVSKDLDATASAVDPNIANSIKDVDAMYSGGIKKLQDSLLKAINRTADKSPEKLHKLLIMPDSPSLIKAGKEVLGEDGFNQIRKQWFDNLISKSKSIIDGEEVISPMKLAQNIRKMGSSLDELFSDNPELRQKITELSDVSKLLTRGDKVTKGSQTAYLGQGTIGLIKNISSLMASPLVKTETGRQFLTTGFPELGSILGKTAGRATQIGSQSTGQIIDRNLEDRRP